MKKKEEEQQEMEEVPTLP
jgi:hypothetical protein